MNDSFAIGRLFGIELRVHVLFVYLSIGLITLGAMNGSGVTTAAFLGMLVVLVLLHELGHARVAQHFGVQVIDIVLWPLGGMARMTQMPEDPKVEGWVAIAGPLVNLVLAGVGALALLGTQGLEWINPIGGELTSVQSVLALFVVANLMLGIFNLVPAFPMDGGRLLRAWFARKLTWLEATERAVRISRVIAVTMVIGSFFVRPFNCTLPLIGIYVLFEGARELWGTRIRYAQAAAGGPFGSPGDSFPGGGGPGGAPGGFSGGPIDLQELFRRARRAQGTRPAPAADAPSARTTGKTTIEAPGSRGGFSNEDVAKLERSHGPLRRRKDDEA